MKKSDEKISVVIVHYRSLPLLKLCLRSLFETARAHVGEIIVVHSAAEWESGEVIRNCFPSVKQLDFAHNLGYAAGVNRGLAETRFPYILILNPDVVVAPAAVGRLISFMRRNRAVGIAGPRLINFNGTTQISYSRFYTPRVILFRRTLLGTFSFAQKTLEWFHMENRVSLRKPYAVDWLMGSAFLVRRKAFDTVGPMDEQFFMYFEDVDWCRRFWLGGYKVAYVPQAVMYHYHKRASLNMGLADILFNSLTRTHIQSALLYFRKYGIRYPEGLVKPLRKASLRRAAQKKGTPAMSVSAPQASPKLAPEKHVYGN